MSKRTNKILRRNPIFASLSDEEWKAVVEQFDKKRIICNKKYMKNVNRKLKKVLFVLKVKKFLKGVFN